MTLQCLKLFLSLDGLLKLKQCWLSFILNSLLWITLSFNFPPYCQILSIIYFCWSDSYRSMLLHFINYYDVTCDNVVIPLKIFNVKWTVKLSSDNLFWIVQPLISSSTLICQLVPRKWGSTNISSETMPDSNVIIW